MLRLTLAVLVLSACTPSKAAVQRMALEAGLDSIEVGGWAAECAPQQGAHFTARRGRTGEAVMGRVCCDGRAQFDCSIDYQSK